MSVAEVGGRDVFNAEWRLRCDVSHAAHGTATPFVQAHYLGKWPAIKTCVLVMYDGPWAVGCVVFALPPTQTSVRYGGRTWELARLWIRDEIPRNAETWLLSKAVKHVRNEHPDVDFLVSYADPSAGHAGTIYKAANWTADGRTDDDRKTPRCDSSVNGKVYGRRGNVPEGSAIVRIPRVSKWRFVYALHPRRGSSKGRQPA